MDSSKEYTPPEVLRRASLSTTLEMAFTSNVASARDRGFPKRSRDMILKDNDAPARTTVDEMDTNDVVAETKPGRTLRVNGEFPIGTESYFRKTG
jgi:hypothetical protein